MRSDQSSNGAYNDIPRRPRTTTILSDDNFIRESRNKNIARVPKLPDRIIVDPYLNHDLDYQFDFDAVFAEAEITDNCTICLETLGKKLSTLDCGHVYHSECIHQCFQQIQVIFCLINFYRGVSANVPFVRKLSPVKLLIYILTWTCLESQGRFMV